jgi:hypothetical protein
MVFRVPSLRSGVVCDRQRLAEAVGPIRRGPFSPIAPMDGLAAADQRVVCAETDVNAERLPPPGEEATGDDSSTASN